MRKLDVFVDNVHVGTLHDTDTLSFTYTQDCLSGLVHVPFSALIPLDSGQISTTAVTSFFENLLPEGDQRTLLQARYHVTTVFGLLSKVGGDTAGSVVILPEGETPQPDDYLDVSWTDIATLVSNVAAVAPAVLAAAESNVSLSGAQHKQLLLIRGNGEPSLPLNSSISTHILKPDIKRTDLKVFSSAMNETLIMKVAHECGLNTAKVEYKPIAQACLVERYDREPDKNGHLRRLYQVDLCQLLDKPSGVKYENDNGPSFKDCYDIVKSKSAIPIIDCHSLLQWLFFNLFTGNNDSHAKNLSMLNINGKLRLAPFYDLMCTGVYSGLSTNFAFKIGQHFEAGKIGYDDICELADSIGVKKHLLFKIAEEMADKIEANLPKVMAELLPLTSKGQSDQVVIERVADAIASNTRKLKARLGLVPAPKAGVMKK